MAEPICEVCLGQEYDFRKKICSVIRFFWKPKQSILVTKTLREILAPKIESGYRENNSRNKILNIRLMRVQPRYT